MKFAKTRGFTLAEVLVVILLIGILSGIAVLGIFRWLPGYYLKASARNLKSNFLLCKMRAVKDNANCHIVFTPSKRQYSLCLTSDCNAQSGYVETFTLDTYVRYATAALPKAPNDSSMQGMAEGLTFAGNTATFQPNGRPSETGGVYLQNTEGQAYAVTVTIAGGVQIYKRGTQWELK
jgi:prepilin-type N-terminal cleavage/methylation domain-containing protein